VGKFGDRKERVMRQHTMNHLIKKAMAGEYKDGIVECRVKIQRSGPNELQISLTDNQGEDLIFWEPIVIELGDECMIQNIRFLQNLILEEGVMAEGTEDRPVYEVLFVFDKDVTVDKKKTKEEVMVGPVRVRAKTERIAILKAALKEYKAMLTAELDSLEVKAKRF